MFVVMGIVLLSGISIFVYGQGSHERRQEELLRVRQRLSKFALQKQIWPERLLLDEKSEVHLQYTFDQKFLDYVEQLLRRYKTDYSAIVVLENDTGKILAAAGYSGREKKSHNQLVFSATHPSASVFKVITAAALLQDGEINVETPFVYRGKGSTLYKYQLDNKKTKWDRTLSFLRAFAFSNNVIFAKAAIKYLDAFELFKMASAFGFNEELMDDFALSKSVFYMPQDQYNLAEYASGFNKQTMISPLHGALIASIVANNGILKYPGLLNSIRDSDGNAIWLREARKRRVVKAEIAQDLKKMMNKALVWGTARGSFRRFKLAQQLEIGGKTGSLTGGVPYGKRDWLIAYAIPKESGYGNGISVCVMNTNLKKWHVRSGEVVKKIINYYYKKVVAVI